MGIGNNLPFSGETRPSVLENRVFDQDNIAWRMTQVPSNLRERFDYDYFNHDHDIYYHYYYNQHYNYHHYKHHHNNLNYDYNYYEHYNNYYYVNYNDNKYHDYYYDLNHDNDGNHDKRKFDLNLNDHDRRTDNVHCLPEQQVRGMGRRDGSCKV